MSRILVVDDDPEIQLLIADVLGAVGHQVEVGPHHATLVGEGFSGEFDLITMDPAYARDGRNQDHRSFEKEHRDAHSGHFRLSK